MKKHGFSLTYLVYIPMLVLMLVPAIYLLGTAYTSGSMPGDDCSYVGLFAALGIIFALCAAAALLNIISKWAYRKTDRKVFLIPCILTGLAAGGINILIGFIFLSDGSPKAIGVSFVILALCAGICLISDVIGLLGKRDGK